MNINWTMTGAEIERESFRQIEAEMGEHRFSPAEWRVVRRMIHATADFTIAKDVYFNGEPVSACLKALRDGTSIYCDSNMIRSGISVTKLRAFCDRYDRDSIHCYVADSHVGEIAKTKGIARSLAALEKARPILDNGIILIGNAPLALAGVARMIREEGLRPRVVIGMPVGFVHVEESKTMIMSADVPQIVLKGRRGGSPLAVAALHGILESAQSTDRGNYKVD